MSLFTALMGAVVTVETPIDGQTGVWLKQGAAVISSAMKMQDAVVTSGQSQYVYSRGVVVGGSVTNAARQYVSNGGMASNCHILSGGTLTVLSGGTALAVTSGGGAIVVSDGGYIEYATP